MVTMPGNNDIGVETNMVLDAPRGNLISAPRNTCFAIQVITFNPSIRARREPQ
jgi:hypothetical protein